MGHERPGGAVLGGVESADEERAEESGTASRDGPEQPTAARAPSGTPALLTAGVGAVVVVCLAVTFFHVFLVFLHVTPSNTVAQRYSRQIDSWVFPLFEQNWRLFAPNPESVNHRISARTLHTAADGSEQVSDWFDLTAVDTSAVEHNVFPSHTSQNMLRRAWSSYLDAHGGDDRSRSERARMMQKYLRNIAAGRIAEHRGGPFEYLQLRVVTVPVEPPGDGRSPRPAAKAPAAGDTRYLPWWKAAPHEQH